MNKLAIGAWMLPTASDGVEGLKMLNTAVLQGRPFGIAILDSEFPTIGGLVLAQQIKAIPEISETALARSAANETVKSSHMC